MYNRLTLTINEIPIHSKYTSTRLTVFLFGEVKNLNDYKQLLIDFTEKQLGYSLSDWWFDLELNVAEQEVDSHEAKGLGFYRIEVAYEDSDGNPTITEKYDAHKSKFGEKIY